MNYLPPNHTLTQQFREILNSTRIVIFSGLPGVGKSLYIKSFCDLAHEENKVIELIQWDVARKSFETEYIHSHYPMGDGTVHNGLKIIAGKWLMGFVRSWIESQERDDNILLIEAPLVGNRFSELIHVNEDSKLEAFLSSEKTKIIVPIPTKKVRQKIEEERARQVSEDAKVWSGAKPSVMHMLWKDTCAIANEFGMDIDLSGQPPYSEGIYEYVYSIILKRRHFEALIIEDVFEIPEVDEAELHAADSLKPSAEEADKLAKEVISSYSEEQLDAIVNQWYLT